jgi:hypothetical protein
MCNEGGMRNITLSVLTLSVILPAEHVAGSTIDVMVKPIVELQPLQCSERPREDGCDHQLIPNAIRDIFSEWDYPPSANRTNEGGASYFKASINPETGKAASCTITKSSGYPELDNSVCRVLSRRLKVQKEQLSAGPKQAIFIGRVVWIPAYQFLHSDSVPTD